MPPELKGVIDEADLTDADQAILDALRDGPRTKGAIVDETGLHRNTVGNRLDALKFGEAIEPIHERTALYELVDDPREDVQLDTSHSSEYVQELEESNEDLERKVDRLRKQLAEARNGSGVDVDRVCSSVETALRALEERQPSVDLARSELETALEECNRDHD